MQEILGKIRGIKKTNDEIISRVEALDQVTEYDYYYTTSADCSVQVHEVVKSTQVKDIIAQFAFKGQLKTDVEDIFNDKLDWTAKNWADLKRLNAAMLTVTDKFRFFGSLNDETREELAKYLHNYEIIQVGLGSVEEQTISQQSKLEGYQRQVKEINARIQADLASLDKQGIHKGQPPVIAPPVDPNAPIIGGSLLSSEQVAKLVEWYGSGWKLQYKATRDGWKAAQFHTQCDGKGSSITVIQANGCLFGGFLSISWQSNSDYAADEKASLFTLVNQRGIPPTKFPIKVPQYAAYMFYSYGPTFGGGNDIRITDNAASNDNSYSNFPNSYTDTTGKGNLLFTNSHNFRPTEIEVYIKH